MRSARAPSPPMEGPAADPAADLVDRDAEALEEALVELRMDMVQLLLLLVARSQGRSATMLQDKFPDRNAQTCQGRSVRMYQGNSVTMFQGNNVPTCQDSSATQFPSRFRGKSATTYQGKSAEMCPNRSPGSSAETP